jgi:hypothetical protein
MSELDGVELQLSQSITNTPWDDLIVSILAVNQYSLERTYQSLEGIQRQGISDPKVFTKCSVEQLEERLKLGGCDRGPFMTHLFAKRLASLSEYVRSVGIEQSGDFLAGKSRSRIEQFLEPVNGIGPVVLRNFFLLRGI